MFERPLNLPHLVDEVLDQFMRRGEWEYSNGNVLSQPDPPQSFSCESIIASNNKCKAAHIC